METRKMTLEDLKECIQTVQDGGAVELFLPEGKESDIFRRVELRDYMETLLRGAVPVIYEKSVPAKKQKGAEKPETLEKPKEIDRGKILALAKAGWSDLKIAKEMGISMQEVKRQQEAVNA